MKRSKLPLIAALSYAMVGAGWIIVGYFLTSLLDENAAAPLFELYKGLAFVAVTATVLFVVLRQMDIAEPVTEATFNQLTEEFSQSIRIGERTARWLPAGLLAIIITLLCLLLLGLGWSRENTLKAGEQSANALRHTVAAQTGSALRVIDLTLGEIAHDLGEDRLADVPGELRRRLKHMSTMVRAIWVADHNGRMIHDTDRGVLGIDLSKRDYFLHHRSAKKPGFLVGDPLRSVTTGTWFVSASHPVFAANGEFRGVVVAALDVSRFSTYWKLPGLDKNGSIALFRDNGMLLMRSPNIAENIGKSYRQTTVWQQLVPLNENGIYRGTSNVDGEQRIFGFGSVPDYPYLKVFVGISEQHLLASWRRFAAISVGAFLMVAGLSSVMVFILLRQLRMRIQSQKKAADLARYPLQNRNPVLSVSPSGARLFMNDAARLLLQSTRGHATAQQLDQAIQGMAAERNPGSREFSVGSQVYSASFVPHPPDCCDIYLMDISALRRGEGLLRLFFDLPFIGMAITSAETKHWLRFNDRLCEILGYSREQLLGKTWAEITHPGDLAADTAEFERVLRGETDCYSMDKRFIRNDGATVSAAIEVRAVRHPDRSIEYLVATVADISERKEHENNLRRQRNLYAALSATNEAIARLRDRDALFSQICRIVVEEAGFSFAWVGLLDSANSVINVSARFGDDRGYLDRIRVSTDPMLPEGRGLAGLVVREGKHRIANDVANNQVVQHWQEELTRAGICSTATFPLLQGGKVIGTFHLYSREKDQFTGEIVTLLEKIAAAVSYALDNLENERQRATAIDELRNAEERWQFALEGGEHGVWEWNAGTNEVFFSSQWKAMLGYSDAEIGNSLDEWKSRVHPDDLEPVMMAIDRHFRRETTVYVSEHRLRCKDGSYKWILDRGKVTARDADGKPLSVIGTHTDISNERKIRQQLADSEAKFKGLVEQSLVGIYIIDAETIHYFNPRAAEIFGYAADKIPGTPVSTLVHPDDLPMVRSHIGRRLAGDIRETKYEFRGLRRDGSTVHIGVHGIRTEFAGKPAIVGVLQDITDRLQNEQQIAGYVAQLEKSIMSTVEAISQMVELRDPYTSGHERRVGDLAAAIGTELNLGTHRVTGLRIAGNVHDVGKISVPAEILSKPGRLSEPEFAIVKTHAEKGYDILKNINFPWPVAECVRQHHERLDGSGYPRGLKGDEISLEARILAVADVIESMSTHRPYRTALGLEAAFKEILGNSGSLYDAQVVAVCMRLFREKGYQLPD